MNTEIDMNAPAKQIVQFIYDNPDKTNRQPIGVLAAIRAQNAPDVAIGWSLCKRSAGDRFDKRKGKEIALNRSVLGSGRVVPNSIVQDYIAFAKRAQKYFSDAKVITQVDDKSVDVSIPVHVD